ncbi:MAG: hypothetical protein WC936_06380 [Candidatus Nanoarchaeia archaeon]
MKSIMTFTLANYTGINQTDLTGGLLFELIKSKDEIHIISPTNRDMFEEAIQITDGVEFPIPKKANVGIISEATPEIDKSGYRGWSCPNQGCGVAVYLTRSEISNYKTCLTTLRLRIIHELLHHYQQPADDMIFWIDHSGLFIAKIAGLLNIFSLDAAQWVYYYWLIKRIRWP